MHSILIAGSRGLTDTGLMSDWINYLTHPGVAVLPEPEAYTVEVSGKARGADWFGETWADYYGIRVEPFRADWDNEGKAAGFLRNQSMLDYLLYLQRTEQVTPHVLAFWSGMSPGTSHMTDIAARAGVHTVVVWLDAGRFEQFNTEPGRMLPRIETPVLGFAGPYSFLSNFFVAPTKMEGVIWPTSEHAYQAMKTYNMRERRDILHCRTPGQAKRKGQKVTRRADWLQVRDQVMADVVHAKFTDPTLRRYLLETDERELVEFNFHGDRYWGQVQTLSGLIGENRLGQIHMMERNSLT